MTTQLLPNLKVKPNDVFQLAIALDVSDPTWPIPRIALSKEQAQDRTRFPLITATFARWTWSTKHHILNQSYIDQPDPTPEDPDHITKKFDNHTFNRNMLRHLLVSWSILYTKPDGSTDNLSVDGQYRLDRAPLNGHLALTDPCFTDILSVDERILDIFSSLVRNVVENGVSPEDINKNVREGIENTGLPATVARVLLLNGVKPKQVSDALRRLQGADELGGLMPNALVNPIVELNDRMSGGGERPTTTPAAT